MKILIVIDMQNDFINGALGTKEAEAVLPAVKAKIEEYKKCGGVVIFTRDTHGSGYLNTQEGRNLPVPHCICDSKGWQIADGLSSDDSIIIDKPAFGSVRLAAVVAKKAPESIELVGLCTDICVISNAMILKSAMPEIQITVDASCCAGVTPEGHKTALSAMKMCQIKIINDNE